MLYKGAIFHTWGKKQTVAIHKAFYATLPGFPEVPRNESDIAWLIYDFEYEQSQNRYQLKLHKSVYTH